MKMVLFTSNATIDPIKGASGSIGFVLYQLIQKVTGVVSFAHFKILPYSDSLLIGNMRKDFELKLEVASPPLMHEGDSFVAPHGDEGKSNRDATWSGF